MGVKMMGARVPRIEDPKLLRGEACFVDDLQLPGMLHAAFVRSPYAHARIDRIDLVAARSAVGVVDAFALADAWPEPPQIPVLPVVASLKPCLQHPLARDRVRYVGEPVAVIIAVDRAHAEDAADLVEVDYEPLQPLADTTSAMANGATLLHDGAPGNIAARWAHATGDVAGVFVSAAHVVRERFRMQRYTGVPLETRGIIATTEPVSGDLTIWISGQWPHTQRALTAALVGLDERHVRVIQPEVGGGFGVKVDIYPEDLVIPMAAIRLQRPVKWIEDRREHLLSVVHAREMEFDLELALRDDGTILGQIISDQGGYLRTLGTINVSLAVTGPAGAIPGSKLLG